MTKVTVSDNFEAEISHAAQLPDEIEAAVWVDVRAASLTAKSNIQRAMPVDTGDARARWGEAGHRGGIWEEDRDQLSVTQGAGLEPYEYIKRLNEGSSTQAPAGFIDVEVEKAADEVAGDILSSIVQQFED